MSAHLQATGWVFVNFVWQHLKAATTFRDQVIAIESQNIAKPLGAFFEAFRSYGSGFIMSAAASLEALINEFFITPEGPLRGQLNDFEIRFWGRSGFGR